MTKRKTDMTPAELERTRANRREWCAKNRDAINERQRAKRAVEKASRPVVTPEEVERRRADQKLRAAAYKKEWAARNAEHVKAKRKAKYEQNKDQAIAVAIAWNKANPNRRREVVQRYQINNPEQGRVRKALRRGRERNAEGRFTKNDLLQILAQQAWRCVACRSDLRESGYHADHILPLARGGSNWPENIQALCPSCNKSKGARTEDEFQRLRAAMA